MTIRIRGAAAIGAFALLPLAASAITGAVDRSFGDRGRVYTDFSGPGFIVDGVSSVFVQPDGRILASGSANQRIGIARYLPNGALDSSFGTGGKALLGAPNDSGSVTAIQPDGKIVGVGYSPQAWPQTPMFLFRTDSSGNPDATFGTNGFVAISGPSTPNSPGGSFLQADGRIVLVANSGSTIFATRYLSNGTIDPSYNGTGVAPPAAMDPQNPVRAALLPDGRVIAAVLRGYTVGLVRYSVNGTTDLDVSLPVVDGHQPQPQSIATLADGRIVVGFSLYRPGQLAQSAIARFMPGGSLDATFGSAGVVLLPEYSGIGHLQVLPDQRILAAPLASSMLIRFKADGEIDGTFNQAGRMPIDSGPSGALYRIARQPDGLLVLGGSAVPGGTFTDWVLMRIDQDAVPFAGPEFAGFGWQSQGATSSRRTVTLTNTTNATVQLTSVTTTPPFMAEHNCGPLLPGATCRFEVWLKPAPSGAAVASHYTVDGYLTLGSNAPHSPHEVRLHALADKTLASHFYQAILRRDPEPAGHQFWGRDTVYLMTGFGADVNETWFAMAQSFFGSAEYAAAARDDAGFVRDLYRTFFDREADQAGLDYWTGLIASGMPREIVLTAFMFSPEFRAFTQAIFGSTAGLAEVNMAMDMYRGILGRIPDPAGLRGLITRLRQARCSSAQAVVQEVDATSSAFIGSAEYQARNRTTAQYVADLYNAFLRRAGDLDGVRYWIDRAAVYGREDARRQFAASPEFQSRVQAVIAAGCTPP